MSTAKKSKRFPPEVIKALTASFKADSTLPEAERKRLVAVTQLTDTQVSAWFSKRRLFLKKHPSKGAEESDESDDSVEVEDDDAPLRPKPKPAPLPELSIRADITIKKREPSSNPASPLIASADSADKKLPQKPATDRSTPPPPLERKDSGSKLASSKPSVAKEEDTETWSRGLLSSVDAYGGFLAYPRDLVSKWMVNETLAPRQLKILACLINSKEPILRKFLGDAGLPVSIKWLVEAKKNDNTQVMVEILRLFKVLPLTVDNLREYGMGKSIKSLTKEENSALKSQAEELLEHWKQLVEKSKIEVEEKERKEKEEEEKKIAAEAKKQKEKEEMEAQRKLEAAKQLEEAKALKEAREKRNREERERLEKQRLEELRKEREQYERERELRAQKLEEERKAAEKKREAEEKKRAEEVEEMNRLPKIVKAKSDESTKPEENKEGKKEGRAQGKSERKDRHSPTLSFATPSSEPPASRPRHAHRGEGSEKPREEKRGPERVEESASKRPRLAVDNVENPNSEMQVDNKQKRAPPPTTDVVDDNSPAEYVPNPAWGPVYVMPVKPKKNKSKRSVIWAPDEQLEQVRTFVSEIDTEHPHRQFEELRNMERREIVEKVSAGIVFEPTIEWRYPKALKLEPQHILNYGKNSTEYLVQREREATVLGQSYYSLEVAPKTPTEPLDPKDLGPDPSHTPKTIALAEVLDDPMPVAWGAQAPQQPYQPYPPYQNPVQSQPFPSQPFQQQGGAYQPNPAPYQQNLPYQQTPNVPYQKAPYQPPQSTSTGYYLPQPQSQQLPYHQQQQQQQPNFFSQMQQQNQQNHGGYPAPRPLPLPVPLSLPISASNAPSSSPSSSQNTGGYPNSRDYPPRNNEDGNRLWNGGGRDLLNDDDRDRDRDGDRNRDRNEDEGDFFRRNDRDSGPRGGGGWQKDRPGGGGKNRTVINTVCKFYLRNDCRRGEDCGFLHPPK